MIIESLIKIGLTEEQAKIYTFLINNGASTARKIATGTSINRSLVYKIIEKMVNLGIVLEDNKPGLIAKFIAIHPSKLHDIIKQKENEVINANSAFDNIIGTLSSQFNVIHSKPNIKFYDGIPGLKSLYRDVLNTGADILLIRSPKDDEHPEREQLIRNQIRSQVSKNIHTKLISTKSIEKNPQLLEKDKENLVTRCQAPVDDLDIPSQILIYGNKTAITSFGEHMITTIIEDPLISESFEIIFNNLWSKYKR